MIYALIGISIVLVGVAICVVALYILMEFFTGFSEARKGEHYSNFNERLLFAWCYDKGFNFGGYWTRAFAKKTRTNHGKEFTARRGGRTF